jgi:hypothetical protein
MHHVGLDVELRASIPKYFDIVAPLETQTEPSSLNCDVVNAFQEAVRWEVIDVEMTGKHFPNPRKGERGFHTRVQ